MEKDKQKIIDEINQRIEDLKAQRVMWSKAGGRGQMMAMQAIGEIKSLELEREDLLKEIELEKQDLLNGTNNLEIYKIQKRLEQLKQLKKEANFIKKIKYNFEIKKVEDEYQSFHNKR